MPFSQLTRNSAPGPSISAQIGSSDRAAKAIRKALSWTAGSKGMMKSAAGRPAAQISIEAIQIRFAPRRLGAGEAGVLAAAVMRDY